MSHNGKINFQYDAIVFFFLSLAFFFWLVWHLWHWCRRTKERKFILSVWVSPFNSHLRFIFKCISPKLKTEVNCFNWTYNLNSSALRKWVSEACEKSFWLHLHRKICPLNETWNDFFMDLLYGFENWFQLDVSKSNH